MSDVVLSVEHIYKKFRKGEVFNSLRDLVPALTGRMFRKADLDERDKREFWALQDVSLEVKRGEAFGIVGRNGAGKSTILKILCRVMKPTRGSIVVNDRISALIELTAGFHQDLTGRENIYLYGSILGMTRREITVKLDQIVAFSGLEEFIDTPIKRYSSGMYARLGFSVAAHVDSDILLVDEVLSVGDYAFQNKCVERMREVIRSGATVVFVSHNLKTVSDFCNRCVLLQRGRVLLTGDSQAVISSYLKGSTVVRTGEAETRQVSISKVTVRNQHGECARFRSGDKAWIDVEVKARTRSAKLSVNVYIVDSEGRDIFDTSTERLGLGTFTLEKGESFACTFELSLNMVSGIFRISTMVYRYDIEIAYDRWDPAATIHVDWDRDVRGSANCFPSVTRHEIHGPSEVASLSNPSDQTNDHVQLGSILAHKKHSNANI